MCRDRLDMLKCWLRERTKLEAIRAPCGAPDCMHRSRSVLSPDVCTVQRAEQAAAASSKPIVTRKFRRKALDPDERYAQERAKMEASRVQRAAQEELRQRRRAARDMLRAREVLLLTPRTLFRRPLESLACLCLCYGS